jgi:YVTN family beta-propeller protein
VVAKVKVGTRPINLVITPDGTHVYVAARDLLLLPNARVSVIDATTNKVVSKLNVGADLAPTR